MPDKLFAAAALAGVGAAYILYTSRLARQMLNRATTSVQLSYFDISGLGEPIRFALSIAGMPFTDKRLNYDEFLALKPTLRFGQVPCLTVVRNRTRHEIFQSAAILRYIGQAFDLSGEHRALNRHARPHYPSRASKRVF